jgi:hypothetical protein
MWDYYALWIGGNVEMTKENSEEIGHESRSRGTNHALAWCESDAERSGNASWVRNSMLFLNHMGNRGETCIATGWAARGSIPGSARFFSYLQRPDRFWGQPSLLSNGYRRALFLRIRQPCREADHSPPSSAEVKHGGAIPPLPHTPSWRSA